MITFWINLLLALCQKLKKNKNLLKRNQKLNQKVLIILILFIIFIIEQHETTDLDDLDEKDEKIEEELK